MDWVNISSLFIQRLHQNVDIFIAIGIGGNRKKLGGAERSFFYAYHYEITKILMKSLDK